MVAPRRSARANKGRNERIERENMEAEILYREQIQAEKNRNKYKIEPEEVLCLVCGTTNENYDDDDDDDTREMIQCDSCMSWQHNECILEHPDQIPENHLCNICDPSNPYYKTLKCEIDPAPYIAERQRSKKNKSKKKIIKPNESDDDDFNQADSDDDDEPDQISDEEEVDEPAEIDEDDEDFEVKVKSKKRRLESKTERKPKVPKLRLDDIDQKARDAVTKRFNGMFSNLLKGEKVPNETDSIEVICEKWAKKLESELFDCYHDRETMKLGKDYKEVSTRIFVNVKDLKNLKLRNSIITKLIPFHKLVRMSVNELLNPDLRKEKEEAIKESTDLATFEKAQVSNIRRTHKGDIVLEKENASNNQQFDFNVGVSLDNDEKKFSKSETIIESDNKNPLYSSMHNNNEEEQEPDDENMTKYLTINDEKEDQDLAAILGDDEKKPPVANDEYNPIGEAKVEKKEMPILWEGQTIFTGITNFESTLSLESKTLTDSEYSRASEHLLDSNLPILIEGRLDSKKADKYIDQVSKSRKLILLELKPVDNVKNFNKMFDYFESKQKFGVIPSKSSFIKDIYLFSLYKRPFKFLNHFHRKVELGTKRLFLIFIIKQEFIKELSKKEEKVHLPNLSFPPGFEFLSQLNPNELQIVNNIFETHPETRNNSGLLIQFLQNALNSQ